MAEVSFTTLQQWLEWIEHNHPVDQIELGLDRLRQVYERMALDLSASHKVIVGGTNGKGSTIAMLDQVLRDQGKTVGCFTSPHFLRYNERIKLAGQPVSDELIVQAFTAIEQVRGDIRLTYFEYNTLAALHVFANEKPDVMLLEVGLGGRLDAINIIDADISVVTTVSVDHVDWLGDDRNQIGYEKAGIYRAGRPAVCGDPVPPQKLTAYANDIGALLFQRGRDFNLSDMEHEGWVWQGEQLNGNVLTISGLPEIALPKANAATVLQVLSLLDMMPAPEALRQSLSNASLTGRMQTLKVGQADYILDVAHNPEAAAYLAAQLQDKPVKGRTLMVLGMLADKDIDQVLACLQPAIDHWYLATLDKPRGQTAAALVEKLTRLGIADSQQAAYTTVAEALTAVADEIEEGDRVIIAGSFFTVSEALLVLNMDGKSA
ncbi:bifunctional tetrahydrofolate synthase/dihydrofolate synthase [Amphritea sp. 1_MG-2023]|uniref:bifunctional tetrahydrofolate synthase/dihydrofolate synthase n=1 Tax=Amphritea sp. 1_MG-2023 TaxID=3062670 RepID=UPI0026E313D6|nr:bifunctional tetrahydrofolate synthase/dihydrofolate synthase [Amphritea sp. 1_MG-2023]MDO6564210.1 bifunctional tetrahydrofolate synthase/dihydrofolate synthase [Amphritea sp. 1_MG-2023]